MASSEEEPPISSVQSEIGDRFGVLPNFFRLAPEAPEVTENLWGFARFGYLDNPLPALFKERLFVYLSRFCDVRYCLARHVGFLTGLGKPAGDACCAPDTVEQVVRMLRRPLPRGEDIGPQVALLEGRGTEPAELDRLDAETDVAVFACAAHVFLETPHAGRCLEALRGALREVTFQHLLVFLAFVRTAHFWTKVHPELHLEDDIRDLLGIHEALAECVRNDPEANGNEVTQSLLDELAMLRRERDQAELLRVTLASIGDAVITADTKGNITDLNAVAEGLTGWVKTEAVGQPLATVFRIADEKSLLPGGAAGAELEFSSHRILTTKDGATRPIEETVAPIRSEKGDEVGSVVVFREVTQRQREESLLVDQNRVLERVARGESLAEILDDVCLAVERHISGGSIATVCLAENGGTVLHYAAGGRCPAAYKKEIGVMPVGPSAGSCGTAAHRGESVVVEDIANDPLWKDFRESALDHGLAACWSVPIFCPAGKVRGTFAVYSPHPRRPSKGEMQAIEFLARTAGIAIERQRAEKELRFQLDLTKGITDTATTAIFMMDDKGRCTFMNPAAEEMTGFRFEEVKDGILHDFIHHHHPDGRPYSMSECPIEQALPENGEVRDHEDVFIRKNGEYFPVRINALMIRKQGLPVGTVIEVQDITVRKRAEEALRESEERFRTIFAQTLAGIAEVDLAGRFLKVNSRYCEIVGRKEEELYDMRMQDITHPDDDIRNVERFQSAVAGGAPYVIEKRYVRPDGSPVWVNNSVSVIRDREGEPMHLVAASIDITERKKSEGQLAEALRFYHSSIDALTNHLAVLDENGVILEVNHAWRNFAEKNDYAGPKWGVGLNYVELCESSTGECADDGTIARGIRDVLADRTKFFECEYPCHSSTEQRWFLMRVTRFQSMEAVRVVVTHDNVTQRRAAEERLRKIAAKLSEANHRKNEFLATLAHELRNPLAPIRNGLQLIGLGKGDWPAVERTCSMIDRQLTQMVRLVDDLMDVSRISTGKLELRRERVTLSSVVGSAVETSRPVIDQMGHELTVKLPEQPLELLVDPTRLSQVFQNLLNNAAKYSERDGDIRLTAEQDGNEVVVTVKDRGIGIPADKLSHVFEMFSQVVDPSQERAQGGLGIGLSLVQRLVELHDGTIEARSEGLGKGAEFIVRLPVVAESSVPEMKEEKMDNKSSKLRLLIVDDNRDGADSLALMLDMMGNETHTAYDGEEAVTAAEHFRPDVILLDIGLPKLDGHEACRRIRLLEGGKEMVIIAQTGWGQDEDRERTREAGFDHHLVKPVNPQELKGLLRSIAEQPNLGT